MKAMDKNKKTYESIDDYIAQFPSEVQEKLNGLRKVIREAAPEAEERIRYESPAFAVLENLVRFAVHEHHIGFYTTRSGLEAFKEELAGYKTSEGTVRFPLDQPLPYDLIGQIVKFLVVEDDKKVKGQPKTKK